MPSKQAMRIGTHTGERRDARGLGGVYLPVGRWTARLRGRVDAAEERVRWREVGKGGLSSLPWRPVLCRRLERGSSRAASSRRV